MMQSPSVSTNKKTMFMIAAMVAPKVKPCKKDLNVLIQEILFDKTPMRLQSQIEFSIPIAEEKNGLTRRMMLQPKESKQPSI